MDVRDEIAATFDAVGARGFVHAREIGPNANTVAAADVEALRALAWLDPAQANATTARDMTTLLAAIWTDEAGPPAACASVRDAMGRRENTPRLASGFDAAIGRAARLAVEALRGP